MSAALQVFATPELLELILCQTSMADVLRCQRVSSSFKDMIDHSPSLQEKLFFKAASLKDAHGNLVEPQPNLLLLSALSAKHTRIDETLQFLPFGEAVAPHYSRHSHVFTLSLSHAPYRRLPPAAKALKPGSWSKMTLLQPPASKGCLMQNRALGKSTLEPLLLRDLHYLGNMTFMRSLMQKRHAWVCSEQEEATMSAPHAKTKAAETATVLKDAVRVLLLEWRPACQDGSVEG